MNNSPSSTSSYTLDVASTTVPSHDAATTMNPSSIALQDRDTHSSSEEHQPLYYDDEEKHSSGTVRSSAKIDIKNHRYPFCLVWGPLPLISWFFPWIGHMGIGDSEGKVHDFAGPYFIGIDNFMTPIFKYVQLPQEMWLGKEMQWNKGIQQADTVYKKRMHNICCDNCHHHSARAICEMSPQSPLHAHSMLSTFWLVTTRGKFVSTGAWLCTYLPLTCMLAFVVIMVVFAKQ